MPVLHQPILGARLNTELHPPPEGIQWWEYLINEGPPATSPGDIPGLLPTYGGGSAPYRHNLVEELPTTPVEYPFTRTQGSGSRPWSIGAFLQMQYAYWLRDNSNRARIKTAIENRALIVTEGDSTSSAIITLSQQISALAAEATNPPPVDSGSFTYGHWVAAYAPPAMAASTCGVTVCMRPAEVYKLIRKQASASGTQVIGRLSWRASEPTSWSASHENVGKDEFGNNLPDTLLGTFSSYSAAWAAALSGLNSQESGVAAEIAAYNAGEAAAGRPNRQEIVGTVESTGLRYSVTVPVTTSAVEAGVYTSENIHSRNAWITVRNTTGDTTPFNRLRCNIYAPTREIYPPTSPYVPGDPYTTRDNFGYTYSGLLIVETTEKIVGDIYTDGIYLDPPDPGYGVGEINLVKANKTGTCEVVALVTGGIEEPYVCNLTPTWPSVPNACEAGAEPLPINGLTGELCGGIGDADGNAFGDLDINDLWPDFTTVVIPGSTFLLQDGAEEPLYPTLYGSFVYDSHLKRWGKFAAPFSQLLDYSPLNSPKNGLESYAKFGILGGIVDPDGLVRLFDTTPISSKIVYGKYGYFRQGMTSPEEIRVHMRIPCTGTLRIETSIEGKNISTALGVAQPYADANMVTLYGGFDGRWHNAVLEGQFDISYLEFRGITLGKR